MGKNKKRDKKNFMKMRQLKKQQKFQKSEPVVTTPGIVDFVDKREINKMTKFDTKAKKIMKNFNKKCIFN
jgi:hypothetical protein